MTRKQRPPIPYQQGARPRQLDTAPLPPSTAETAPNHQQGAQSPA